MGCNNTYIVQDIQMDGENYCYGVFRVLEEDEYVQWYKQSDDFLIQDAKGNHCIHLYHSADIEEIRSFVSGLSGKVVFRMLDL